MTSRFLRAILVVLGLATLAAVPAAAQGRVRVGILPFDVANVDGGSQSAAAALAKLVRVQLITDRRTQPVLVELAAGEELPLPEGRLAELAAASGVQVIVAGTVLEATTTHGSNRVYTPRVGGVSLGGSLSRTRAEVSMHVELSGADGRVTDTFEVEGDNTDVGVGTDIWTALGSFDVGDSGWDKSPMGKALREAAEKLASEVKTRTR
ncbi:MAG: hypothetical protein AB7H88_19585 [Vicinamibacterales bacterium]